MPLNPAESGEDYYRRLKKAQGLFDVGEAAIIAGLAVGDRNQATLERIEQLLLKLLQIAEPK